MPLTAQHPVYGPLAVSTKTMRHRFLLLILLFLIFRCTSKEKDTAVAQVNAEFDVENQVNFYLLHDTINIGETQKLMVEIDSAYFSMFDDKPKLMLETQEVPLDCKKGCDISYQAVYADLEENGVLNQDVKERFWFRLTEDKDTVITFSGSFAVTNLSSSKRSEGNLIDGKKEGVWKFWYDDERKHIKEISNWKEGSKEGKTEEFWKSGSLLRTSYYKSGKLDGVEYKYSSSGKIHDSTRYEMGEIFKPTANPKN